MALQLEGRQLVRVEPGPQAVIALAEVGDAGHAVQAAQLVLDVERRVIAEPDVVVTVVRRDQVDDHQRAGRHLLDVDALVLDQGRDDRQRQRDAVLHQHLGHVRVGALLERDRQAVGAVVGAARRHVQHVLDAADLLLDRRRHGVAHGLGVGAGVDGRHLHRGRRHVGVLRHRQREHGHAARQHEDHGNDGGEDRTIDEEACNHDFGPPVIRCLQP